MYEWMDGFNVLNSRIQKAHTAFIFLCNQIKHKQALQRTYVYLQLEFPAPRYI